MENEKEEKEFCINFTGWTIFKATSEEDAIDDFWAMMYMGTHGTYIHVEEIKEKGD